MLAQASGDRLLIKDIAAELKRHGVSSRGADGDVRLLDAESDAELDAIAERYVNEPTTLWCGAAGLASALTLTEGAAEVSPPFVKPTMKPRRFR
jgi:uncharacterized protein YgbK (DUF1537 family)